ncbi:unnamed protein product [Paramecium primaurelia]|uniref:Uncharacterized protein n=1 Tax=Paramecium primaurelia TaxID=5886 RepID=A0A8S1QRA9_PARPR|nr:unnamed protein product [Paramecium primaurelia]
MEQWQKDLNNVMTEITFNMMVVMNVNFPAKMNVKFAIKINVQIITRLIYVKQDINQFIINVIQFVEIQQLHQMNNVMMLMKYLLMDAINVNFLVHNSAQIVQMDNVQNVNLIMKFRIIFVQMFVAMVLNQNQKNAMIIIKYLKMDVLINVKLKLIGNAHKQILKLVYVFK